MSSNVESINRVIMDWLVINGFHSAVEEFQREALEDPQVKICSIYERAQICRNLETGNCAAAVDMCGQLYPEVLSNNKSLHFKMLQQHCVELIRESKHLEALQFGEECLAPFALELVSVFFFLAVDSVQLLLFVLELHHN